MILFAFRYIDSKALHCECNFIWLSKWLRNKLTKGYRNVADWFRVLCYHPKLDMDIKLIDVHYKTDKGKFTMQNEKKFCRPKKFPRREKRFAFQRIVDCTPPNALNRVKINREAEG